jgi:general stress protein YciG
MARKESIVESTQQRESRHSSRGFASMDEVRQKEIARKGGRAAHAKGTAHEFTTDEARAAGQKGGQSVSSNREHMSRIGRIGGKKSAGRRQQGGENSNGNAASTLQPGQDGAANAQQVNGASSSSARNGDETGGDNAA